LYAVLQKEAFNLELYAALLCDELFPGSDELAVSFLLLGGYRYGA
jgi:hypothetical protein